MTQAEQYYKKMTETPVEKLIISLSIPTIISMLISNIYNLVDTYFVGTLGVSASGAVGVVFTLMSILQAIGFTLGHGAGSITSRLLAQMDVKDASHYVSTSFFPALFMGLMLTIFGIPLINPLMRLLGSTETILPYARDYGLYILLAAPVMIGSLVLNNILRYEGKAFYGMIGLTIGGILNMIGDPIFIYGFKMGVAGAGLATALSQLIGFLILLFMHMHHAQAKISIRNVRLNGWLVSDIVTTGMPSMIRQGMTSISSGILNNCAGIYGDACVSAMAITGRCQFFMLSIALASARASNRWRASTTRQRNTPDCAGRSGSRCSPASRYCWWSAASAASSRPSWWVFSRMTARCCASAPWPCASPASA